MFIILVQLGQGFSFVRTKKASPEEGLKNTNDEKKYFSGSNIVYFLFLKRALHCELSVL